MYKQSFASQSSTGWFEAIKMDYGWQVYEVFKDGSHQNRTVEKTKEDARKVLMRLNFNNDIPKLDLGHGVSVEHEVI